MTESLNYIAVYSHGSWGGPSKDHAADPDTHDKGRYTSRCGQRYMIPSTTHGELTPFDQIMHLEQCQRCVKLLAKDQKRWEQSKQHYAQHGSL
jgi:hypothetical protein